MSPTPRDDVPITGQSIKLGQFLKLANVIESGSHAKLILAEEQVSVNGEPETRRGRQLEPGDTVDVGDQLFLQVVAEAADEQL